MDGVEERSLWRMAAAQMTEGQADGRSIHKRHCVCTEDLLDAVEEVGKQGWVEKDFMQFSICPETRSGVLEDLPVDNFQEVNWLARKSTFPE